jgi:hypothetical protein
MDNVSNVSVSKTVPNILYIGYSSKRVNPESELPLRRVVYHGVWMTAEYLKKPIYCSVVTQKLE